MFGDDLIDSENAENATAQLLKAYNSQKEPGPVIAIEEIAPEMTESYGVIKPFEGETDPLYKIEDLVEKPAPKDTPSNLGIIGKYVCTPEIFDALHTAKASVGGEIRLIDGFKKLQKTQPLHGLKITGARYDTGTLNGYRKAINGLSSD